MVEIRSPVKFKDMEGKLGVLFSSFEARGSKKELLDTQKMVVINLKREESVVLMDKNDCFWELYRNKKGHYNLRRLKVRQHKA